MRNNINYSIECLLIHKISEIYRANQAVERLNENIKLNHINNNIYYA